MSPRHVRLPAANERHRQDLRRRQSPQWHDIKVRPGECVGLCGENGAGKSTLMKVLSAVYPYGTWAGEIVWDGQPLKAHSIRETEAAGIVIIHPEFTLVPDLSVAENTFMGHEQIGRGSGRERVCQDV